MSKISSDSTGAASGDDQYLVEEFGDALTCGATILVHQCNMTSRDARGIAQLIFRNFPTANCYIDDESHGRRETAGGLGRMELVDLRPTLRHDDTCSPRFICNLFGQHSPGKGGGKGHNLGKRRLSGVRETRDQRLCWFRSGLDHLRSVMQEMAREDRLTLSVNKGSPIGAVLRAGPYTRTRGDSSVKLPWPGTFWRGKSIAFPFLIGCGLAGGSWPEYRAAIEAFAKQIHEEFGTIVQLIALPNTCSVCKGTFNEQQGTGKRFEEWSCHLCRQSCRRR